MSNYVIICSVFDIPHYLINVIVDRWTPDILHARQMTLEEAIKAWESLTPNYKSYSSIWSVKQKWTTVLHEKYESHILAARVVKLEQELATLKEKLKCNG